MKTIALSLLIFICSVAMFPYASVAQDTKPIVRLIYFLPRDREPQPNIDEKMDGLIKNAQQLYANQMEAHGFGRKTFQFETDASGNAVVHHFVGQFTDTHYSNLSNTWDIWEEIGKQFDASKNIYVTVIEMRSEYLDSGGCDICSTTAGRGGNWGASGGRALVTAASIDATAHELGHAFGLMHDYRNKAERVWRYSEDLMLNSFCAAQWLDAHRAFNPAPSLEHPELPKFKFKMLPPSLASPPNAIRLRFEITGPNGIHQVQLLTEEIEYRGSLLEYKYVNGNSSGPLEFVTTDLTLQNSSLWLWTIDMHGNIDGSQEFPIDMTSIIPPPETISIPDRHLAAAVQREIGNITTHSLLNLFALDAPNSGITDLTGLEHTHNLEILNLGPEYIAGEGNVNSNTVSDVSALSGLTRLRSLNLEGTNIDMSTLSGLTHLRSLYLGSNNISDISALSGLTHLRSLFLGGNNISDISALSGLTHLSWLHLGDNNISDISALSGLTSLTSLYLVNNNISDISVLSGLTNLISLYLVNNNISDISVLSGLTNLISLNFVGNNISDISVLSGLTNLTSLNFSYNSISDVSPLSGLTQLTELYLTNNTISDLSALVGLNLTGTQWDNTGLYIERNPLNYVSLNTHLPAMQAKGVEVQFDRRTYPALDIISGTGQYATGGDTLANPFVVAAIDKSGTPMRDVSVTFAVVEGTGELTATTATTDARGRAETTLTVGTNPGRHRVRATAPTLGSSVPFIAIATAPAARLAADVNADGVVNIQDLVLVSSRLGQTGQNAADVNGDGAVNIQDLVLVAGELGTEAAAPSAWHCISGSVPARATVEQWITQAYQLPLTDVRSQRGIFLLERLLAALVPKETALLANYPNPFNPETWIPYQLAKPADVTLTIYAVNGQVVRQLSLGHQLAGTYQSRSRAAYWDGRNAQGEPVASGIFFYTLSAGNFSATRKMLIRK